MGIATYLARNARALPSVGALLSLLAILFASAAPARATVIKAGMSLNIVVKNDKELSQIVKVNDNGTIDYPLYQDMSVIDKTTSELQDILTYKLAKVVESTMVLVSVLTENPINLYVLGQVKKPGLLTVPPKASLQEVMLLAGGTLETADLQRVKVGQRMPAILGGRWSGEFGVQVDVHGAGQVAVQIVLLSLGVAERPAHVQQGGRIGAGEFGPQGLGVDQHTRPGQHLGEVVGR